jgi:hypothetical protein
MKVTQSDKHTSLLRYGNDYDRKKFYGQVSDPSLMSKRTVDFAQYHKTRGGQWGGQWGGDSGGGTVGGGDSGGAEGRDSQNYLRLYINHYLGRVPIHKPDWDL